MGTKSISRMLIAVAMLVGTIAFTTSSVEARHGKRVFTAGMNGFEEVPSISTAGHGRLWIRVSRDEQVIEYKLSYAGLSSAVTEAHIHFAQPHTNGGMMVTLCQSAAALDPTSLAPMCVDEGMVQGTITAPQVVGPAEQGIGPGQLREFIRALRARAGYVNVHTERVPSGEIRGQIR